MYIFRQDIDVEINQTIASKELGITNVYLCNVLNGKHKCKKPLAIAITYYLNKKAKIEDYFEEVE